MRFGSPLGQIDLNACAQIANQQKDIYDKHFNI
jgi:hypothetical protein